MAERVTVHIPTPLRGHTGGQAKLEVAGATVREVLGAVGERHPQLWARLFDEKNELNRFVNVFLNEEDVRFLQNLDTPVADGDGKLVKVDTAKAEAMPGVRAVLTGDSPGARLPGRWWPQRRFPGIRRG